MHCRRHRHHVCGGGRGLITGEIERAHDFPRDILRGILSPMLKDSKRNGYLENLSTKPRRRNRS
jgi:hypothetical protein